MGEDLSQSKSLHDHANNTDEDDQQITTYFNQASSNASPAFQKEAQAEVFEHEEVPTESDVFNHPVEDKDRSEQDVA